ALPSTFAAVMPSAKVISSSARFAPVRPRNSGIMTALYQPSRRQFAGHVHEDVMRRVKPANLCRDILRHLTEVADEPARQTRVSSKSIDLMREHGTWVAFRVDRNALEQQDARAVGGIKKHLRR